MIKYMLPDSSPEELYIWTEDTEFEADGEFVFDTVKEAKTEAISRINDVIRQLESTKKHINNFKG